MLWMVVGNPPAGFYEYLGGEVVRAESKPFGAFSIDEVQYRWDDFRNLVDS